MREEDLFKIHLEEDTLLRWTLEALGLLMAHFLLPRTSVYHAIWRIFSMADLLLNEQARMRLARVLDGKGRPEDVDRKIYHAIQRGECNAVTFRHLSAIAQRHGDIVLQAIPGLKR